MNGAVLGYILVEDVGYRDSPLAVLLHSDRDHAERQVARTRKRRSWDPQLGVVIPIEAHDRWQQTLLDNTAERDAYRDLLERVIDEVDPERFTTLYGAIEEALGL